jgi:hypothetical protein
MNGTSSSTNADPYRHLRNEESTDHVINTARHQAGMKTDVHLEGRDVSTKELKEEQRQEMLDKYRPSGEGALTAAGLAADLAEASFEGAAVGLIAPGLKMLEIVKGAAGDCNLAEAQAKASETDAMHMAVLGSLKLPDGFRNEAMEPYRPEDDKNIGFKNGFMRVSQALDANPQAKDVLQLHADRGSTAALDLAKTGELHGSASLDGVLAKHPEMKKKFDEDPAYRAGVQLVAWAQDHGKLRDVAMSVLERDARYNANHVQYRG